MVCDTAGGGCRGGRSGGAVRAGGRDGRGRGGDQRRFGLKTGATVTDVGSVKAGRDRDRWARICPKRVTFYPGRTRLAGTEHSGPQLRVCRAVRRPLEPCWCRSQAQNRRQRRQSCAGCGKGYGRERVEEMDAEHHDLVLAVTSHAPHLIAYTMVGVADDLGPRDRRGSDPVFGGTGFRDFTRIAACDPTMWRDVFLCNKDATLEILGRFTEELFALQRAIRPGDGDHLFVFHPHTCDSARDYRCGTGYRRAKLRARIQSQNVMRSGLILALVLCASPVVAQAPADSLRPVARAGTDARNGVTGGVQLVKVAAATGPAMSHSLRPNLRTKSVVQKAMAKRNQLRKGAVCGDLDIQGEPVGRVPGKLNGCGISDAVRVRAVSGIRLSQASVMQCGTAKALKT